MKAIVFDTEVNSLESKEVIELAYCEAWFDSGELSFGTIEWQRFKPKNSFEAGAVAVHRILPEDVDLAFQSETAQLPHSEYIIAHNVDFDAEVMKVTNKKICTLAISRRLWPQFKSHSLSSLFLELFGMNRSNVDILKSSHSAATDVMVLNQILTCIVKECKVQSFDDLFEFSEEARIPIVMLFGKHKGTKIADLDSGYVN